MGIIEVAENVSQQTGEDWGPCFHAACSGLRSMLSDMCRMDASGTILRSMTDAEYQQRAEGVLIDRHLDEVIERAITFL